MHKSRQKKRICILSSVLSNLLITIAWRIKTSQLFALNLSEVVWDKFSSFLFARLTFRHFLRQFPWWSFALVSRKKLFSAFICWSASNVSFSQALNFACSTKSIKLTFNIDFRHKWSFGKLRFLGRPSTPRQSRSQVAIERRNHVNYGIMTFVGIRPLPCVDATGVNYIIRSEWRECLRKKQSIQHMWELR